MNDFNYVSMTATVHFKISTKKEVFSSVVRLEGYANEMLISRLLGPVVCYSSLHLCVASCVSVCIETAKSAFLTAVKLRQALR